MPTAKKAPTKIPKAEATKPLYPDAELVAMALLGRLGLGGSGGYTFAGTARRCKGLSPSCPASVGK